LRLDLGHDPIAWASRDFFNGLLTSAVPDQPRRIEAMADGVQVFVSTRKGAWFLDGDAQRGSFRVSGPHHFGHIVHHVVLDPRDGKTLLAAAKTGHLGPTVFRSTDRGETWTEAKQPPAFPKVGEGGRAVDHVFWLTPGHASEPGVWWAGSSPQGLFKTKDGGVTWDGVPGFNENAMYSAWTGGPQDQTPDGPKMHSINVDPRDAKHVYIGMSSGGVFETTDGGASWAPMNEGIAADFLPDPNAAFGHDPHCLVQHPTKPDRLYQQNHCGIYRVDRPERKWTRIGNAMPKDIGDVGFPMVVHPRNPDVAWVFPMDGGTVWPRTSLGGKPAVFRTRDAGASWERQDAGFPREQAWWTVKRQSMAADHGDPVGLYFGTTSGEVWMSRDEGAKWTNIARHLPHVYAVTTAPPRS
jgi:photosystem II stability/assembly factor-like uncharacterized protein